MNNGTHFPERPHFLICISNIAYILLTTSNHDCISSIIDIFNAIQVQFTKLRCESKSLIREMDNEDHYVPLARDLLSRFKSYIPPESQTHRNCTQHSYQSAGQLGNTLRTKGTASH